MAIGLMEMEKSTLMLIFMHLTQKKLNSLPQSTIMRDFGNSEITKTFAKRYALQANAITNNILHSPQHP